MAGFLLLAVMADCHVFVESPSNCNTCAISKGILLRRSCPEWQRGLQTCALQRYSLKNITGTMVALNNLAPTTKGTPERWILMALNLHKELLNSSTLFLTQCGTRPQDVRMCGFLFCQPKGWLFYAKKRPGTFPAFYRRIHRGRD
jgi:hypothetical protein